MSSEGNTERDNLSLWILRRVLTQNTSIVSFLFVFLLVESWWPLGALNPFTWHDIVVGAESAFWLWEHINEIFKTISSYSNTGLTSCWSMSWEERLNHKSVLTIFVSLFNVSGLPFTLDFTSQATGRSHAVGTSFIFALAFEVVFDCTLQDDI